MGTVYKATDLQLQRTVAIKMLHTAQMRQTDAFKRFRNEAQLSARISHPNVATLYDFHQTEAHNFIVMEYVDGKPLDKIIRLQGKIPQQETVKITLQILEGLGAAHELGIMHRDLKPSNIMIDRRGFVKLMDFGIARLEHAERLTRQNSVIGTLEYLAPELIKGGTPSKSSDLYAVGVMLHEMLVGRTLFEADTEASLMYLIAHTQPEINLPAVDRRLVRIIKKLIHKQPGKRYQSTREVIRELEQLHAPGKVNVLLLEEKLPEQQSGAEVGALSAPLKKLKLSLPHISLPSLSKTGKPPEFLGIDWRILAPVVGVCLLILLIGSLTSGPSTENSGQQEEMENAELAYQAPAESSTGPVFVPPRQPQEIEVEEWNGELVEPKQPHSSPKKHEILPLEASPSSPGQPPARSKKPAETPPRAQDKAPPEQQSKSMRLSIPQTSFSATLDEKISSEKQQAGQTFFLRTTEAIYVNKQLVIPRKARVKGRIKETRKGNGRGKAYLAFDVLSVQAANGSWLEVDFPTYTHAARGEVEFPRGFQLNKITLKPTTITLK